MQLAVQTVNLKYLGSVGVYTASKGALGQGLLMAILVDTSATQYTDFFHLKLLHSARLKSDFPSTQLSSDIQMDEALTT